MASRLSPGSNVRAAVAKAMLAEGGWSRDEYLSRELMASIWRHEDGRALVRFGDGRCRLHASHAELTAWYEASQEQARRGFRWEDVIPEGTAFPERVPELIRGLPLRLELAWTAADGQLPPIEMVERAVRRLGQKQVLTPDVLPSVVAYVGELVRRRIGGEWTVQDSGHGPEPDLVVRGSRCGVMQIYKQILEHDRRVSLVAFVEQLFRSSGA